MDLLKRSHAPITPEAWKQIDAEAKRVLQINLAGRKLVDFDGPHGWQYAAVNTGRLTIGTDDGLGVPWGVRDVERCGCRSSCPSWSSTTRRAARSWTWPQW